MGVLWYLSYPTTCDGCPITVMQRWAETHCRCATVSEEVMRKWQSRSWIYWKHFAEVLIHKDSLLSQKLAPRLFSHVYAVEVCKGLHWFQAAIAALGFNTQMYRFIAAGRRNVTRSKNPFNSAISFNSPLSWFWHCYFPHGITACPWSFRRNSAPGWMMPVLLCAKGLEGGHRRMRMKAGKDSSSSAEAAVEDLDLGPLDLTVEVSGSTQSWPWCHSQQVDGTGWAPSPQSIWCLGHFRYPARAGLGCWS